MQEIQFDFRPEAMNISWEIVEDTLSTLQQFILSSKLWYGIGSEEINKAVILDKLKSSVSKIY